MMCVYAACIHASAPRSASRTCVHNPMHTCVDGHCYEKVQECPVLQSALAAKRETLE